MLNTKQPKPNQTNEHNELFDRNAGKMRGKPKMVLSEKKKVKGTAKHSLRKEK